MTEQIAFGFWHPRHPKPSPAPARKRRIYKVISRDLKSGIRVSFRLARSEAVQLVQTAKREDMTVSELVRDSLYDRWGIGELEGES
jgi:predicted DNA-binding ribbon-helix-helix protein